MNSNQNKQTPFFSFNFLTEYTHNYLAVPYQFDQRLKEMLVRFETKGYLDNTMLIVMGDHGNRLKHYAYATEMGKLERWLPFLSIKFPIKIKQTMYHQNAINNKDKLISFFDVYQTLRHYLQLNKNGLYLTKQCEKQFSTNSIKDRNFRGISLLAHIPLNRSCSDAFIPSKVCSCFKQEYLSENEFNKITGVTFKTIGFKVAEYINELLKKERIKCNLFKLSRVVSVKKMIVNNIEIFKLVVVLKPGDAWFEANLNIVNNIIRVHGNPYRLSPYGNQSICMKDPILVNYCFCKLY